MKVKLVSPKAELTVLQSLTNRDLKISGTVLSMIDASYFYEPLSKELYTYIKNCMAESPVPPKPRQILADPELSEEARTFFKSIKVPTTTVDEAIRNVNVLNKYRRTRIIYDLAHRIGEAFNSDARLNIDSLTEDCAKYIVDAQSSKSTVDAFLHLGSNDNAKELLHDLVYAEDTGDLIKTGFTAFDKISGGFDRGGLVTIGAPSGCGKSTVSTQLAINFARQGYKVVLVPLEMSKKEMGNRILANIGNMELSKIRQHKLDDREKVLLTKRQKRWRKQVNAEGGRLTIFKPEADLDIDEVYAAVSGLKCDVVIVDYISLLKGIDDENQWLRLGTIARKAKINAEVTNRVNIMVCQVSDEGKIRYSGAIKEHCITGDSLIDTDKGFIRIDSLYPEAQIASTKYLTGIKVKSDGGYQPITAVHYNGIRPVYKITLENGMSLKCTASHKFRVLGKNKLDVTWSDLAHVYPGDYIAIDNTKSLFGKDYSIPLYTTYYKTQKSILPINTFRVNKFSGYVLGAICGDGYIGKWGYQFIASDHDILNKYVSCWEKIFKQRGKIKEIKTKNGVTCWRHFSSNKAITHTLKSITQLHGHAKGKYLPDMILCAGKNTVKQAICGLFDADGTVGKSGGHVQLCSYNKHQLHIVQMLLQGFGIFSRQSIHSLSISGVNAYKFAKTFQLTSVKQNRLDNYRPTYDLDILPKPALDKLDKISHCRSLRLKQQTQRYYDDLKDAGAFIWSGDGSGHTYIKYKNLAKIMKKVKMNEVKCLLQDLYKYKHNRFLKVVSIEKLGEEKVYDLTVANTHCYVANGIVTHNSNSAWIWTPNEEEKKSGLIRVEQIKSRNSEPFPFTLKIIWNKMQVESVEDTDVVVPDITDQPIENLASDI